MAYCTQADVITEINGSELIAFLDDDGDGQADPGLLDSIIDRESSKIDGRLSSIYQVPFSPVPPAVRDACTIFVAEALYRRRLTPDEKNPFKMEADEMRERLKLIGNGKLELDQNFPRAFYQGVVVTNPLAVNNNSNSL